MNRRVLLTVLILAVAVPIADWGRPAVGEGEGVADMSCLPRNVRVTGLVCVDGEPVIYREICAPSNILIASFICAPDYRVVPVESFTDISEGHRRWAEIDYVRQYGWFNGYPDGTFQPDRPIKHGQAVAVLQRAFGRNQITEAGFELFLNGGVYEWSQRNDNRRRSDGTITASGMVWQIRQQVGELTRGEFAGLVAAGAGRCRCGLQ